MFCTAAFSDACAVITHLTYTLQHICCKLYIWKGYNLQFLLLLSQRVYLSCVQYICVINVSITCITCVSLDYITFKYVCNVPPPSHILLKAVGTNSFTTVHFEIRYYHKTLYIHIILLKHANI